MDALYIVIGSVMFFVGIVLLFGKSQPEKPVELSTKDKIIERMSEKRKGH